MRAGTVVVLFGSKGVGKTHVARLLSQELGVHHVDADPLVLDLMAKGVEPDATYGWLVPVQAAVEDALRTYDVVAVEATGAWPTDWEMVERLKNKGFAVVCLRLTAPKKVAAARVANREEARAPATEAEIEWIYDREKANSSFHQFDLVIDTASTLDRKKVVGDVRNLLEKR